MSFALSFLMLAASLTHVGIQTN